MATVNVKYKCGDNVVIIHKPPTNGIVTAIFIRGKGRVYEVGFTGSNGPTSANCDEVELDFADNKRTLGFGKD